MLFDSIVVLYEKTSRKTQRCGKMYLEVFMAPMYSSVKGCLNEI